MNEGGGGGVAAVDSGFLKKKKKRSRTHLFFCHCFFSLLHSCIFFSVQDYMTRASEWCLWGGRGGLHPGPTNSSSVQAEGREIIG